MNYRIKLILLLLCAIAVFVLFQTSYEALNTLSRLETVEADRDQWQRPTEVIDELGVQPGNVVADVGCGSGYFAVRLSPVVGKRGRVLAEDIRRLPLVFLWFRTLQKNERNVTIVHGDPNDPELPVQSVNAVLIANTYHEFTASRSILAHVSQSLVSGGRLVVLDRRPQRAQEPSADSEAERHEISAERVESELREAGFAIVSRDDRFIENDPDNEKWWVIVARKT